MTISKAVDRLRFRSQAFRYLQVGLAGNALGYLLYLLLAFLGFYPKVAMSVMYGLGMAVGFVGNWRYTFSKRSGIRHSLPRYLAAHLLGYLVNLSIHLLGEQLGIPHQLCQAVGIAMVAVLLFVLFRQYVFQIQPPSRYP